MPRLKKGVFRKVVSLFDTEAERDRAFNRKLQKDFNIATGRRVIKKITRRHEGNTLYGFEVKRR